MATPTDGGRNGECIVKNLCRPVGLREGGFRKINSRSPPAESGRVEDAIGKPRHKHNLVLGGFRVPERMSQKKHSSPGGQVNSGGEPRGRAGGSERDKSIGNRSITRVYYPMALGRLKAQNLSKYLPVQSINLSGKTL